MGQFFTRLYCTLVVISAESVAVTRDSEGEVNSNYLSPSTPKSMKKQIPFENI